MFSAASVVAVGALLRLSAVFSLVWRSGNALSAIFTRVTSATCGSRIIASIRSSGDRFSFAARAAIAAWVKAVFLFGVPF